MHSPKIFQRLPGLLRVKAKILAMTYMPCRIYPSHYFRNPDHCVSHSLIPFQPPAFFHFPKQAGTPLFWDLCSCFSSDWTTPPSDTTCLNNLAFMSLLAHHLLDEVYSDHPIPPHQVGLILLILLFLISMSLNLLDCKFHEEGQLCLVH